MRLGGKLYASDLPFRESWALGLAEMHPVSSLSGGR